MEYRAKVTIGVGLRVRGVYFLGWVGLGWVSLLFFGGGDEEGGLVIHWNGML